MGKELVAFRDERGKVAVLDAVCPHFGAHLGHGGTVENGCIRCPFHALEFDRGGQCVGGRLYTASATRSLRVGAWTSEEAAGCIFVWHGPNRAQPGWRLPIEKLDWEGWTKPVTNAGRALPRTNMFFPTENIIDMTHFVNVHRWQLHEVLVPPHVDDEGCMKARIKVTWVLAAQSEIALVRALGSRVTSPFEVEFVIKEPGIAVATTYLTPEQGSLTVRSVVLITPVSETDCHIRAVMSVKDPRPGVVGAAVRRALGVGFTDLMARAFLAVGTADFTRDALIWSHRTHLEHPRQLKEDGPIILYRKWSERFWPDGWARSGSASLDVMSAVES